MAIKKNNDDRRRLTHYDQATNEVEQHVFCDSAEFNTIFHGEHGNIQTEDEKDET